MGAETKIVTVNGVKITLQLCWNHADKRCKQWFVKNKLGCKKHKYSCSQYCAIRKCRSWKERNVKKPLKISK